MHNALKIAAVAVMTFALSACDSSISPLPSAKPAALSAMPDTTPPGKPHFDTQGAHVGDQLPALLVYTPDASKASLDEAWYYRPTLLITCSYTCPKSRSTYPSSAALELALKDKVNVAYIYVIEAHPSGDPSPYSGVEEVTQENLRDHILCAQPRTLQDRLTLAARFQRKFEVTAPIFVDSMDNSVWKILGGGPNMGVLVDQFGVVVARQGWFDAASMQKAAETFAAALPQEGNGLGYSDETYPAINGDFEKIKAQIAASPELVKKVFPIEARGSGGDMTLLHYVIQWRDDLPEARLAIVQFLVEKGADVNKQTIHKPSPLHLAAAHGKLAIAKYLIDHGAHVNAKAMGFGPTPLQEAMIHSHPDMAELLIKSGAKPNFFTEVASGNISSVAAAIKKDPSLLVLADGTGRPALAYAAACRQFEMAKLLLAAGARDLPLNDYQFEGRAIWWAVVNNKDLQITHLLCESGCDPNLLDYTVGFGEMELTKELLAHKADPNLADYNGDRPLHHAAENDRPEFVQILLEAGADINAHRENGRGGCGPPGPSEKERMVTSPLYAAAEQGSARAIAELLKHGAKIKLGDSSSPLHAAAASRLPPSKVLEAIKLLVEAKADINAIDEQDRTPLDYALESSRTADKPDTCVVDYLKAHGAIIAPPASPETPPDDPAAPQ